MRFIVFKCRNCEHHNYVENTEDAIKMIGNLSNSDCPSCGEEPDDNWLLVGLSRYIPDNSSIFPSKVTP